MQRTLVLCKPDSVQRKLVGIIINRFENKGLTIIGMKMMCLTKELLAKLYSEHVTQAFYPAHEAFMLSGPVVAIVLEGPEAAATVRRLIGITDSRGASPGSIRGDYSTSYRMNVVHASDNYQSAVGEIAIFFEAHELMKYTNALQTLICATEEEKL